MNQQPRREALLWVLGGFATLAGGCASRRASGEPLVSGRNSESGEDIHVDAPASSARGEELLREWRERGTGHAASPMSGVIPRSAWTREDTIERLANPLGRVNRITVHHDGMNAFTSTREADSCQRLEQIRRGHVGQGWADIGYHFAVDPAGRIFEGRPLHFQGAHVKDNNENNVGVLVLGNFMETRPTGSALTTLDGFLSNLMSRFGVPLGRVYTHQELKATACPGTHLQRYMVETRSRTGRLARA